ARDIDLCAVALTIIKRDTMHFIILMPRLRQTSGGVLTSTKYNNGAFHSYPDQ
ncbi:hypothetical protein LTSERUB_0740, partial [Salmonella enterica subsp. enterica serovar Rubislaw str. A4-653]